MTNQFYKQYIEKLEEYKKGKQIAERKLHSIAAITGTVLDAEIFNESFMKQIFVEIADREMERLEGRKVKIKKGEVGIEWAGFNVAIESQISYWKHNKQLIEQHD